LLLSRLAGSLIPTADRFILLLVPLPHFGVSQVLLVLPLPGSVQAQAAVGFDDAAECHAGHLKETVLESALDLLEKGGFFVDRFYFSLGLGPVAKHLHFELEGQTAV
jgi:hypothetical protein